MPILFKNTANSWGFISIFIHWITALTVISLFILGLWMTGLDYYNDWYRTAPYIHKSIGILLFILTLFRVIWRIYNKTPKPLTTHLLWERKAAHFVHILLYFLLFSIMISGYLISTADSRPISVFDLFEVPAMITFIPNQEDTAGTIHLYLAYTIIGLVVIHLMAAFKHHFINKDRTLTRMLKFYKQGEYNE